ncbi:MAG: 30S ribosomal protein S24e [Candidatus Diapherotrites archaeon]
MKKAGGNLMKIEITERKQNPSLGREEILFAVTDTKSTPSRKDLRAKIAALCNAKEDCVAIGKVEERFGMHDVSGSANIYASKDAMDAIEPEFIVKRNVGKNAKKEGEEPAAKEGKDDKE